MIPTRDAVLAALLERWHQGALPTRALDDWRVHPGTLVALLDVVGLLGSGPLLDVGAGARLTLARTLAATGRTVLAADLKRPVVERDAVAPAVAHAAMLPFRAGAFPLVVSRLFLGAPVSQAARRIVALGRQRDHATVAGDVERDILGELARVTAPGGWQVHHVLERVLFSSPEDVGLEVLWPIAAEVPTAPPPWKDHPAEALRYHLSGVLILRKRERSPMLPT